MFNTDTSTASNKLASTPTGVILGSIGFGFLLGKMIAFPSFWMIIAIVAVAVYLKRR